MKRNEILAETVAILIARGFTPTVVNGGKHFKVSWSAHGRKRVLIISRSPSDFRANWQSRAILRRLLRADIVAQPGRA